MIEARLSSKQIKIDMDDAIARYRTDGEPCCCRCQHFCRLKHNYQKGKGFEDSYCCNKDDLVIEVMPTDKCNLFEEKEIVQ